MGRLVVEQECAPKRPLQPQLVDDVEATGHSHKEARGSEAPVPDDVDLDDLRHQEQPELDGERLVADPGYLPLQPPGPFLQPAVQPGGDLPHGEGPPLLQHGPFRRARQRHELLERPYHVQRKEYLEEQGAHYVKDSIDFGDYVFAVTLPEPANEKE